MELQTLKEHRWASKLRRPGDRYTASRSLARVAIALGWSAEFKPAPEPVKAAPVWPSYYTTSLQAETEEQPKKKRTYRRRDQVSE